MRSGRYPDMLYLIATPGSKTYAKQLSEKWQKLIPKIETNKWIVDMFDLNKTMEKVGEIIDQEPKAQIVINFSSGTNPMQAGAFTRAVERNLLGAKIELIYVQEYANEEQLQQYKAVGRRGDFQSMILCEVPPLSLYYDHLFNRGLELFKKFDYERAEAYFAQAWNFACTPEESNQADGYCALCQAYSLWDGFVYNGAAGALRQAASYLEDQRALLEEKGRYVTRHVFTLKGGLSLFYTVDMLENAVREFVRGSPHEALLKAFRFFELVMEYQLAQGYNFFEPKNDTKEQAKRWKQIAKQEGKRRKVAGVELLKRVRAREEIFYGLDDEIILELLKDSLYKSMVHLLK